MADAARFSIGGDEQGLQYHRVCTAHSPCIPCRCLRSFESPDPAPCMRVRALEIGGSRACVRACTGRGLRTDNLLASWFRFCSNTCSCLPKFQLSRSNPYRIRKGFNTMRPALRSPRQWRPEARLKSPPATLVAAPRPDHDDENESGHGHPGMCRRRKQRPACRRLLVQSARRWRRQHHTGGRRTSAADERGGQQAEAETRR